MNQQRRHPPSSTQPQQHASQQQSVDDSQTFLSAANQTSDASNMPGNRNRNIKCNRENIITLLLLLLLFVSYAIRQMINNSSFFITQIPIITNNLRHTDNSQEEEQIIYAKTQTYTNSQNNNSFRLPAQNNRILNPTRVTENILQPLNMSNLVQAQAFLAANLPPEYYANTLYENWEKHNVTIDLAEFIQLQRKYNINKKLQQKSICIISPFKNLLTNPASNSIQSYLQSLNSQNYSNFYVYMIDDASTDRSTTYILKKLKSKYLRLNNRLSIIQNNRSIGALGNRDIVSRYHCKQDDIIMEVDADDCLIGRQTLKLYNKIYSDNPHAWFVYSNYIMKMVTAKSKPPKLGRNQEIRVDVHEANTYRTTPKYWVTVHLRSYLRKLYTKIPIQYFTQNGTNTYYLWASDRFNMYPLVQLAGPKHTLFIPELLYYYNLPDDTRRLRRNCDVPMIRYQQAICKLQTPLMPLLNLQQKPQITKNYQIPNDLILVHDQRKRDYEVCIQNRRINQK